MKLHRPDAGNTAETAQTASNGLTPARLPSKPAPQPWPDIRGKSYIRCALRHVARQCVQQQVGRAHLRHRVTSKSGGRADKQRPVIQLYCLVKGLVGWGECHHYDSPLPGENWYRPTVTNPNPNPDNFPGPGVLRSAGDVPEGAVDLAIRHHRYGCRRCATPSVLSLPRCDLTLERPLQRPRSR